MYNVYIVSWVLCFFLSPPEVSISLNSTHLSLITLPAVLHHHGLCIHLTPATLPIGIVHVFVLSLCVSHAGDTCTVCLFCVPVVYLLFFFFCLVGLFVVYSNIFLQLDPDPVLPRCLILPFRDRIPNSKNRSSREASQCPPGRPENWGLCQGLHGSGSPVRYGKDHPHAHLLGRHGWDLQIPDALLGPRGVAGGLHQSGSEFERLSLQSSISCRACSVLWAHRVRCRARSVQNNLMQCATYGLSTDRLTPPPPPHPTPTHPTPLNLCSNACITHTSIFPNTTSGYDAEHMHSTSLVNHGEACSELKLSY